MNEIAASATMTQDDFNYFKDVFLFITGSASMVGTAGAAIWQRAVFARIWYKISRGTASDAELRAAREDLQNSGAIGPAIVSDVATELRYNGHDEQARRLEREVQGNAA